MTHTPPGSATSATIDTIPHTPADEFHSASASAANQPFTRDEYAQRIANVQTRMRHNGLDVLLVHSPENLAYLTGYDTSGYFEYQVLVVPAFGDPQLLIRNVERLNVDESTWLPGAHIWRDGTDFVAVTASLVSAITADGTVGIEAHSWFVPAAIAERLTTALPHHQVTAAGRLVETLRLVKSTAELEYVRAAARIADITMAAAIEAAGAGVSETAVSAAAHYAQVMAGGEYPALPHYVSSGSRTDIGHATWSAKLLAPGELMKMEFLGARRRYHAGLTRAIHIGKADADTTRAAALCLALQDETFAELRAGASVDAITRSAQRRSVDAGLTPIKMRLGYSMGIGFPPIAGEGQTADFREGSPLLLESGMVFHMLAVMRVGLVFSDTVVITDTGFERLTQTPRTLVEV